MLSEELVGFSLKKLPLGAITALGLGVLPLILAAACAEPSHVLVLAWLNCFGFSVLAVMLLRERQVLRQVSRASKLLGIPQSKASPSKAVQQFVKETTRYHRAAYAFQLERNRKKAKLSENLWRSVSLAYKEFKARAVELALLDQETGQWTQTMLVGEPTLRKSQSMLCGQEHSSPTQIFEETDSPVTIVKPVAFAGTTFGFLRIELVHSTSFTQSDRHVLNLLATQVGILLVDARFTDELLRMHQVSEETVRAKTGFLANLSHEIRGPLGIILNGVELALDGLCGEVGDELKETLRMIKDSINHLLDLVNDVLDYAKVEAGKIVAKPCELILAHLLEDIVSVVHTQAAAKKHEIVLEEINTALGIVCDKRHARQILINFLTNAIKYTPDGGTITVSAATVKDNQAKISIRDTGIGIAADERDKVFAPFERLNNKYAASQVGTGLGMPLTRRLAEVNGGVVGFESEEGKGSTFWVILPSVKIENATAADATDEKGELKPQGHGEAIMLVDHDADTRGMLERYLGGQGFCIVNATNASEVLRTLREREINLVVVENDMPDLPGEEMVAAIRSTPRAQATPIILLSSHAFVFDVERFLKLGVDRCLSKPVPLADLALTARRLIDEARKLN